MRRCHAALVQHCPFRLVVEKQVFQARPYTGDARVLPMAALTTLPLPNPSARSCSARRLSSSFTARRCSSFSLRRFSSSKRTYSCSTALRCTSSAFRESSSIKRANSAAASSFARCRASSASASRSSAALSSVWRPAKSASMKSFWASRGMCRWSTSRKSGTTKDGSRMYAPGGYGYVAGAGMTAVLQHRRGLAGCVFFLFL